MHYCKHFYILDKSAGKPKADDEIAANENEGEKQNVLQLEPGGNLTNFDENIFHATACYM